MGKNKKNKKNKNNNISRLFGFPAKTLWKEIKASEKNKKTKKKKQDDLLGQSACDIEG